MAVARVCLQAASPWQRPPLLSVRGAATSQVRRASPGAGRSATGSRGKTVPVCTTLLVKGLEFDHAIVLDAGSLARKELYVALTRGAKSLTVISSTATLNPVE